MKRSTAPPPFDRFDLVTEEDLRCRGVMPTHPGVLRCIVEGETFFLAFQTDVTFCAAHALPINEMLLKKYRREGVVEDELHARVATWWLSEEVFGTAPLTILRDPTVAFVFLGFVDALLSSEVFATA